MDPKPHIAFSLPLHVSKAASRAAPSTQPVRSEHLVAHLRSCNASRSERPVHSLSRRAFLTAASAVAAEVCLHSVCDRAGADAGSFPLPALPYAYDALEPYISAEIMHAHHDTHFATYADKLNKAVAQLPPNVAPQSDAALVDLLANLAAVPDDALRTAVRNNGGGYLNHKMFFAQMAKDAPRLSNDSPLGRAICSQFGSFDTFRAEFMDKATTLFGSGFTWLVKGPDASVSIVRTPNQDNPAMQKLTPVLACDCWEHAWYYQYGPKKKDYLNAWWNVIDWAAVNDTFVNA